MAIFSEVYTFFRSSRIGRPGIFASFLPCFRFGTELNGGL